IRPFFNLGSTESPGHSPMRDAKPTTGGGRRTPNSRHLSGGLRPDLALRVSVRGTNQYTAEGAQEPRFIQGSRTPAVTAYSHSVSGSHWQLNPLPDGSREGQKEAPCPGPNTWTEGPQRERPAHGSTRSLADSALRHDQAGDDAGRGGSPRRGGPASRQ